VTALAQRGGLSEIRIGALSGFGLEGGVVEKRPAAKDGGGGRARWWCEAVAGAPPPRQVMD
jgi:hypothetical protein